jgi:hypothetical protein
VSNLDLGDFDVVVHLAESVINQGLELIPNGSTFPIRERQNVTLTALGVPAGPPNPPKNVPLIYDAFLEIERPQVTIDQAGGTISIRCSLSPATQLTFLRTSAPADAALITGAIPQIPLAGSVQLDCPFGVGDVSAIWGTEAVSGRSAIARAGGVAATIELIVPSADSNSDVPVATAAIGAAVIKLATDAIDTALETAFGTAIGNDIGDLPLTNPVRLNAGATPVQTARTLNARISPPGLPSAISLGVLSAIQPASPGGVVPSPPAALSSAGALIGVANYWTLQLICTAMKAAHPGLSFTINRNPPSASFNGAVVLPGGDEPVTLRRLDITVDPNGGLVVDGHATASGSCWDAKIDFDFKFGFTCDPTTGTVVPSASVPNVDVDVNKDIWCQILGAIVGAIGGFIVGAIIGGMFGGWGALIGGIAGAVVGGIGGFIVAGALIDPLDLDGVSLDSISVLAGLTLPLPVGAAGFLVQTCDFDDLSLVGDLVYVDLAERHRSGSVLIANGSAFDLDAGVVRTSLDNGADLLWSAPSLSTLPGSVIGPVFANGSQAFGTLSLTDLEGFAYASNSLGVQVPFWPPDAVLFRGRSNRRWVAFAVRTTEGRYAKCRAHSNLVGTLTLEYVVYARPVACLGSLVTLDALSQTVVESGTETCTEVRPEVTVCVKNPRERLWAKARASAFATAAEVQRTDVRHTSHPDIGSPSDIFDLSGLHAKLPPRCPRPCGPNTTIEHLEVRWEIVDRKQQITIQALPSGIVAPLTYHWTVFGTELTGSGTATIGAVEATYNENSPILMLVAAEGNDVVGSVVVHATDADGRKLRVIRQINSPSRRHLGGCCPAQPAKLTLHDATLVLEHARTAHRIYEVGVARLAQIAESGYVIQREPIGIREAVAALRDK